MASFTRRELGRAVFAGVASASVSGRLLQAQEDCAPPPGTPVDFVIPAAAQNIVRKSVAELNASEIARLRLAYQRLRALTTSDPGDPRGWLQQAHVHCWQCGGSGPDSNIHGSWTFLPWHRAYLYFHERILCKLLNDNSFRLPYWSWDDPNYRTLPAIYHSASIGSTANSLYDASRSGNAVGGKSIPSNVFPTQSNPMNSPNFEAFGGDSGAGGSMEFGPHGNIHMWVGGEQTPLGDMSELSTAARDPVFYAHHCNIDRLWAEFVRRNPAAHANPTDPDLLTRGFQFFDENKQLVNIRVQDVLDPVPLGFSYRPGAKLGTSKPPKWTRLKYDSVTHLIQLSAPVAAIARQRSVVVKNVQLPTASGSYNVFVGDPPAAGADQFRAPNYVGYIGIIVGEHHHDQKCSLVLNATSAFLQSAGGAGALLTFAPTGTTNGQPLAFSAAYLTEE